MTIDILKLEDIRRGDVAVAGGKGANLGELLGNGFPVPPGFIISALACEDFFKAINLEKKYRVLGNAAPGDLENHCRSIRTTVVEAEFPRHLGAAIIAAHSDMINSRGSRIVCAVRSSANAEDLANASFAGQHETYYYVEEDRLLDMVKHCWASLWSNEAVSYRMSLGIDHGSVFMAVVVQEMVQSEISGVTFTANPVTGSREEIVTESSWGMGAAIVDGRVTPDHYVIERKGLRLREKRIAEKRFMVMSHLKEGSGMRIQEVPHGMRQRETLSTELARIVAEWSVKAEDHFGRPQDVEWAIVKGRFYMLQSRPITVIGREEMPQDVKGQYVLFKPIVENFTDPLTPLTGEMITMAFQAPLLRLIRGRLYLSLKHIRALLPFKNPDEDLVKFIYGFGAQPIAMKISLFKLPFFLAIIFFVQVMSGVLSARAGRGADDFMDNFRKKVRKVDEDTSFGPFETVLSLLTWPKLFEPVGHLVMFLNFYAQRYWILEGLLKRLLRRWLPDLRNEAEALLVSGSEGMLSAMMGRDIWFLSREAKGSERLRDLLLNHNPEQVLPLLQSEPEAADFLVQLERFLGTNGHRALKELELQSVRWEENPTPVLGMIRNYLLVDSDPMAHEKKMNEDRADLEREIRRKLEKYSFESRLRPRWRLIRYLGNQAKYFAKMRENSRFYHTMAFYTVRKKVLGVETELMRQGKLKCKGDIFFLRWHEIAKIQAGKLGWLDVEERIRERRMEHIRLSKMTPPKTIGIKIRDNLREDDPGTGEMFTGRSASPGNYEGTAHVILDPSTDIELKPGEVLIAPYTDPAWTPLFLTAGAAVVEIGSYLSHAGTVAREFGMPCVVDVKDCTKRIHTGVQVEVDGDNGVVRIITDSRGDET